MKIISLIALVLLLSQNTLASGCFGYNLNIIDEIAQGNIEIHSKKEDLEIKKWIGDKYKIKLNINFKDNNYILYTESYDLKMALKIYELLSKKIDANQTIIASWSIQNLEIYDDCSDTLELDSRNKFMAIIPLNDMSVIKIESGY